MDHEVDLIGVEQIWIESFFCQTGRYNKVKKLIILADYYLPITGGRSIGFMTFSTIISSTMWNTDNLGQDLNSFPFIYLFIFLSRNLALKKSIVDASDVSLMSLYWQTFKCSYVCAQSKITSVWIISSNNDTKFTDQISASFSLTRIKGYRLSELFNAKINFWQAII